MKVFGDILGLVFQAAAYYFIGYALGLFCVWLLFMGILLAIFGCGVGLSAVAG